MRLFRSLKLRLLNLLHKIWPGRGIAFPSLVLTAIPLKDEPQIDWAVWLFGDIPKDE